MSAIKKDDCKQQLRRMCKDIAQDITDAKQQDYFDQPRKDITASDWMEGVYDIEWITYQDKTYKSARLMVAGGGPSIWVNLQRNVVQGYWWGDYCEHSFQDNIGLDEYLEEIFDC
jgi:RES domain-containing protein